MKVEIPNSELTTTINALSQLAGIPPGLLKVKLARIVVAVLRGSSSVECQPLTALDFEELAKTPIAPGMLAFLAQFCEPPPET